MTLSMPMPNREAWTEHALCTQADPELFYPEMGGVGMSDALTAKRICARCPVVNECLEYAVTHYEQYGVWGGTGPREREELRAQLRQSGRVLPHPTSRAWENGGRKTAPAGNRGLTSDLLSTETRLA